MDCIPGIPAVALFLFTWFTVLFFVMSSANTRMMARRYTTLSRPSFAPASWVYGIVWFAVATLLAYGVHRIHLLGGYSLASNQVPLALFWVLIVWLALYTLAALISLTLNAVHVFIAWALALTVTILFWQIDTLAGVVILIPTLWLTFAFILAVTLAIRNSGDAAKKLARDQISHGGRLEDGRGRPAARTNGTNRRQPVRRTPTPQPRQPARPPPVGGGVRTVRQ